MANFERDFPDTNTYEHYAEDLFADTNRTPHVREPVDDEAALNATLAFVRQEPTLATAKEIRVFFEACLSAVRS